MAKDVYYFSHDANARHDEKILMLRAEHGWEGYGIYWALIEMMFESSDTSLHHNKTKGVAVNNNIDITVLESVINTCITEHLFASNDEVFWSESLRKRKDLYKESRLKKSNAGKKGMAKRWGNHNTVITEDNKGKESKGKESIKDIVEYLNKKSGKGFKLIKSTQEFINARLNDGYTIDDFKKVIDTKVDEWTGTDQEQYIRPNTLFRPSNFEAYLNQKSKVVSIDKQKEFVKNQMEMRDQEHEPNLGGVL